MGRQISLSADSSGLNGAQEERNVSGKVTDSSGAPLPGVTVIVKGTTQGIITDFDGKYTLANVPSDATLMFSFVGMKTQEIKVSGKSNINVVLEEEAIGIEEVVAIGYGTVRRKDLTGSVASVSGSALKDIPVTSAAQAIIGRIPGVQVTKTEGSPDAEIKIRVRGGGSLTQDNSPLYIVDGFPVDNINDIAPTDIESIDVLKDASSTAIYGARGANGVILITTKSGFEGKGKVSYNTYFGVKEITKTMDVLNPYEFVFLQFEVQGVNSTTENFFGDFQDIDLYKQINGNDWQDQIFGRTGTSMYHNLAVSGGTKISKYNISLTRNDDKEIMIGSGLARTNLNIRTFNKINDWLSFDLNARLSDSYLKGAGTSTNSRLSHALNFRPVDGMMKIVDSELVNGEDYEAASAYFFNPLTQTEDDYRRLRSTGFNFNGAANIQFSESLVYRIEYGAQYGEAADKHFYGIHTSNTADYGRQPIASIANTKSKSYRLVNTLTYNKRDFLPGNNINVVIGEELNSSKSESVTTSAKYFPQYIDPVSALSIMTMGTPDPTVTVDYPANRITSFFGRANYDYKGKYLVSATFRADGSSKFAPGNQWGYFPSAALAWRMTNESFMKASERWLSDLKLRISYGEAGNNRISDNAWRSTFKIATSGLYFGEGASPTNYFIPASVLSNSSLKWETTITRNVGLDFGFFKQRLTGTVELYKNTTKDLLVSATIPSSTGYSTQWQNIGQTSNRGLEISLNGVICEGRGFRLSASFNIGFNKNQIDKLGETKKWEETVGFMQGGPSGDYLIEEGGEVGLMYGYETDGMYSFDDFTYNGNNTYTLNEGVANDNNLLYPQFKFMPGVLKLKNQDDNLIIDANDKVVIGNANPKHSGGFSMTAQLKGFDISAFFNWVYGNDIYNANKLQSSSLIRPYKNLLGFMDSENRFTYFNKETGLRTYDPVELAEINKNATIWSPMTNNSPLHSWVIEDGSFLRLNNITLGYSLPKNFLKVNKFKIESLRIYATAYNLWTWTNYSGYDPEVDSKRSTPLTPGVDWCAYPRSRSFNIGLNVEF
ncbi:MAG: SusC/RagA family TonB-linked outer membrane protein [Bacteroidetes bacterium GWF2_42_66]|nr:MAG: SusC/RagA family TonB-linked outer membrane protein [Bacteroidetes bacterium GWA2_42_15]OFY01384.1 MAG: SusC/RagA family TonB-linked outer membrane protein [Bacteroidetes bacterium GWE2_42_39]OFY42226.1 MAG: SusC/RagA family TonB-linked outer membrane protein [Bacteroidetes bacterium GWF2_42_66]